MAREAKDALLMIEFQRLRQASQAHLTQAVGSDSTVSFEDACLALKATTDACYELLARIDYEWAHRLQTANHDHRARIKAQDEEWQQRLDQQTRNWTEQQEKWQTEIAATQAQLDALEAELTDRLAKLQ